ncbi:MAG: penicillin-binding protein 2 [Candidatus Aminicenantales bacterium]
MPGDKIYEDLSVIIRRANAVFRIVAVALLLVLSYYWKTQILDFRKFWDLAESNRTRIRVLSAPRGLIRDRTGAVLADNRVSFKVSLLRESVKNEGVVYPAVSKLLGISEAELRSRVERYKNLPLFEPLVIQDGLEPEKIAPIEARRLEFPELEIEAEPRRSYPNKTLAAHVLGYLQERSPEEIRDNPGRNLRLSDMGGRAGLERQYDDRLTGQDGSVLEIVDSLGRKRGEKATQPPTQGRDIHLSISAILQTKAEELLGDREGAIVALDPSTGEILAMASSPTFDPNRFIGRFTPEEWVQLTNGPSSPLENRAIRGLYAPGSIFKLVMAMGGLDLGYVTDQTTVYCNGSVLIYGTSRACWFHQGHGSMNLVNAIRNSCNIYFYTLGRQMGIDPIAASAGRLGLGRKTGLDLPGEKEGLVPSEEWKMKALKTPWFPGETISVAIGQGQLQVTPLQIAVMTGIIANRGGRVEPHLLLGREGSPGAGSSGIANRAPFKHEAFESVIEGMWRSVNDQGTGQGARVDGMDICGKTGSTQVVSRERAEMLAKAGKPIKTHSWFSGFAPRDKPRIVVTVLVEFGGGGGAIAGPLAGQMFRTWKDLPGK